MMETVKLLVTHNGDVLGTCVVEIETERMTADLTIDCLEPHVAREMLHALDLVKTCLAGEVTAINDDPLVEMRA